METTQKKSSETDLKNKGNSAWGKSPEKAALRKVIHFYEDAVRLNFRQP
jgi:hypothetical protein